MDFSCFLSEISDSAALLFCEAVTIKSNEKRNSCSVAPIPVAIMVALLIVLTCCVYWIVVVEDAIRTMVFCPKMMYSDCSMTGRLFQRVRQCSFGVSKNALHQKLSRMSQRNEWRDRDRVSPLTHSPSRNLDRDLPPMTSRKMPEPRSQLPSL